MPEWQHQASSILRIHRFQLPQYKIWFPQRNGARDLCTPYLNYRWCPTSHSTKTVTTKPLTSKWCLWTEECKVCTSYGTQDLRRWTWISDFHTYSR